MLLRRIKVAVATYEWSDSSGDGQNYPQPLLAKLWELKHPNVGKDAAPSKEQLRDVVVKVLDAKFSVDTLNKHIAEIFLAMQQNRCFHQYIEATSGETCRWGQLSPNQVRVFVDYVAKPEKLREAQDLMKNMLVLLGFFWNHVSENREKANLAESIFQSDFANAPRELEIPVVLPEIVDLFVDEIHKIYTQNDYFVRDGCGWNLSGLESYAFDRSDPLLIEALSLMPDQEWYDVRTVWGPWSIHFQGDDSGEHYREVINAIVSDYEDDGDLWYANVWHGEWPDANWVNRWIHPDEPPKNRASTNPVTERRSIDKIVWEWMANHSKSFHYLHEENFWTDATWYRYKIPFGFRDLSESPLLLGEGTLDFVTEEYAALYNAMLSSDRNEPRDLDEEIKRIDFDA